MKMVVYAHAGGALLVEEGTQEERDLLEDFPHLKREADVDRETKLECVKWFNEWSATHLGGLLVKER